MDSPTPDSRLPPPATSTSTGGILGSFLGRGRPRNSSQSHIDVPALNRSPSPPSHGSPHAHHGLGAMNPFAGLAAHERDARDARERANANAASDNRQVGVGMEAMEEGEIGEGAIAAGPRRPPSSSRPPRRTNPPKEKECGECGYACAGRGAADANAAYYGESDGASCCFWGEYEWWWRGANTPHPPGPASRLAAQSALRPYQPRFEARAVGPGVEDRSGLGLAAVNALNGSKIAFKSKVVSRAHAEVWCEEGTNGTPPKFFIRDTKSSSGTFLNHVRLSPAGTESRPHPLKDGDILQLGVDYQGGAEDIYKSVEIRVELGREWQGRVNGFKGWEGSGGGPFVVVFDFGVMRSVGRLWGEGEWSAGFWWAAHAARSAQQRGAEHAAEGCAGVSVGAASVVGCGVCALGAAVERSSATRTSPTCVASAAFAFVLGRASRRLAAAGTWWSRLFSFWRAVEEKGIHLAVGRDARAVAGPEDHSVDEDEDHGHVRARLRVVGDRLAGGRHRVTVPLALVLMQTLVRLDTRRAGANEDAGLDIAYR
ncbi:hypothetical protein B0H16DRAFT_1739668 [Mycena metata]|uniref:FHA domain-containing protein n=1 Tax=Mycena metata TaxID=1033252 RepID=A0AAD7HG72_9AGAR|nr:hypothetical protein B0H16DRAFT_1739668 [Mycena metata]